MQILFWILWVINLLIMLVCLYETFAVSSNSSLAVPAFILLGLVVGSWWVRNQNPKIALALVALPAALLVLWLLFIIFKGDWK